MDEYAIKAKYPMTSGDCEKRPEKTFGNNTEGRGIYISVLVNGYIVEIGCKRFMFPTLETAFANIKMYLENPTVIEEKFYNGTLELIS